MLLGILLVISCLVILFIKRKKKIEDRIYYGKLINYVYICNVLFLCIGYKITRPL